MNVKVRPYKRGGWEVDIALEFPNGEKWRERLKSPVRSPAASLRWGKERAVYVLTHWKEVAQPQNIETEITDPQIARPLIVRRPIVKPQITAPQAKPISRVPTLAEFQERFLRDYALANRQKPSTIDSKKSMLKNHLVPLFGKMRLDEIRTADVQRLKSKLAHRKVKTVNHALNLLSVILRVALKWEVIDRMPCQIELLKGPPPEMHFYDFEEHHRLVQAASELDPRIHLLVLLGCDAGLRCGEILALEWGDIDFRRNLITVSRSEWRGQVTVPKGGRSRRVPMTRQLAEALQGLRHLRSARVFWREDGHAKVARPLLCKWLARAQHRAGLKDNGGLHIMRHTFCSHLAMQGVPVNAIKELAGHQDLMTTMRYMHLSPSAKEAAVLALEDREAALARQRQAESAAAKKRVTQEPITQPIGCAKMEAERS